MKQFRESLMVFCCLALVFLGIFCVSAGRMEVNAETTAAAASTGSSDTGGNAPGYIDSSVTQGRDSDVLMTNLSAPDTAQGQSVTIDFTVSTNYDFTAVSIDTNSSDFPFIKNENAYRILVPAERSDQPMNCSFTLDVKSSVVTGYYPVTFCVEYIKHGHHMYVNKVVDVYIVGKASSTEQAAAKGKDSDVSLTGLSAPRSMAGETSSISFDLQSAYELKNVTIDTSESNFPFVKNENVYKNPQVDVANPNSLHCDYNLDVKSSVMKGYYSLNFCVEYMKDGQLTYVNKLIDVYLDGEEATDKDTPSESTPRVIVTGYTTDLEKIYAGNEFELNLGIKNTSEKTAVSNLKLSLTSANNEFLPSSGSSTMFINSIPAGGTRNITIMMKAQASLEQKPYVLAVEMEYESEKHKQYTAKESISIPIYLETKMKVSSVEIMPSYIDVGSQANVMFNINNAGKSAISNVQVKLDSEYVQCDEVYVGTVAAGGTSYADFMVTGIAPTQDDGTVKVIITYEDSAGIPGSYETSINLFVAEPVYIDENPNMPVDVMPEENQGKDISLYVWIGIGVAAVVLVIIIVVIKKKKKEEELEDEIS